MLRKTFIYVLGACLTFSSCRGIKNLAAKDSSGQAASSSKSNKREVVFLDNVSVTPGKVVTSKHITSTVKQGSRQMLPDNNPKTKDAAIVDTSLTAGDIEKANWLQLKYAIALNTTVEAITNLTLINKIEEWWGTRYALGGSTKNGIDCSAFTQVIMKEVFGKELPRTAQEQYKSTERLQKEELQEGDLVFFHTSGRRRISHVGVYIMNNKFVHSGTSTGVTISDLTDTYWTSHYRGAGRLVPGKTKEVKEEEED